MLSGGFGFLFLLVLVLAIVKDPDNRRLRTGGNLDQIKVLFGGESERLLAALYAYLITFRPDKPDLRRLDRFIDPGGIPYPAPLLTSIW